jgi:hypothetical protein
MEEDKLNLERQDAHGKIKAIFEKRTQLYKRYPKEDSLTELERLMLSNRQEWQMSHFLGLKEHEDITNKLSDPIQHVYQLKKAAAGYCH